jgi:hypothetical protein
MQICSNPSIVWIVLLHWMVKKMNCLLLWMGKKSTEIGSARIDHLKCIRCVCERECRVGEPPLPIWIVINIHRWDEILPTSFFQQPRTLRQWSQFRCACILSPGVSVVIAGSFLVSCCREGKNRRKKTQRFFINRQKWSANKTFYFTVPKISRWNWLGNEPSHTTVASTILVNHQTRPALRTFC